MTELLQHIADKISNAAKRVVLLSDPDGLLNDSAICSQLSARTGYRMLHASSIVLRVDFELYVRQSPDEKVCYISAESDSVLPDVAIHCSRIAISLSELFPNFSDKQTLRTVSFEKLAWLYAKHIQGRVSADRLQQFLSESLDASEPEMKSSIQTLREMSASPDWSDVDFAQTLGKSLKEIFAGREFTGEVAKYISDLNFDFQHYLHDTYFASLNSIGRPKAVHNIAQYLQSRFTMEDKLCLIVVDGMAWWQWEVLRDELERDHRICLPEVMAIMAWLPSITALSRQAIFRGAQPLTDYRQTPSEEEKLWKQMWKSNPIFAPIYQHNVQTPEELNPATRRLAIVDVALDKKMHQSNDYYDLHDLTRNWAVKFAKIIKRLRNDDFKIVLTTDHGSVLAQGTGTLRSEDKAHLYLSNSRGERFVYFQTQELQRSFAERNYITPFFKNSHDCWLAIANDSSFSTAGKRLITHGGSHFMETLIPLVIF